MIRRPTFTTTGAATDLLSIAVASVAHYLATQHLDIVYRIRIKEPTQ